MANVERVGLRPLVNDDEIAEVMTVLTAENHDRGTELEPSVRRYVEKVKVGLADVSQVLRDLHLTRSDKQLSYGERRVYEMAMELLVQEISVAEGRTADEVRDSIEQVLG